MLSGDNGIFQKAKDAKAHRPDKVAKRIYFLNKIRQQLNIKEIGFER